MSREIYKRAVAPHNMRVATDAGVPSDNVQAAILLMQDNLEWVGRDKFMCISPELFGSKIRTSAPYQFATKGYSANSPQRELGDELIANGDFNNGTTGWQVQAGGEVSVEDGKLKLVTSNSSLSAYQVIQLTAGKVYRIQSKITNPNVNWAVTVGLAIAAANSYGLLNKSGGFDLDATFTASASGNTYVSVYLYTAGTIYADNISIREVLNADLTQSTANSQPYLSKIAPSEPQGLQNTNGDSRFMSHPAISFAANEKWTLEAVFNWNEGVDSSSALVGNTASAVVSTLWLSVSRAYAIRLRTQSGSLITISDTIKGYIGKTFILHIVANGNGTISSYINGILNKTTNNISSDFSPNAIFPLANQLNGRFYELSYLPAEISASRIAYRSALLRSIFAEIPTVRVAGLDVAVRALDIVCTPAGNLIPEMQLASNTANLNTTPDLNTWSKSAGVTINSATGFTSSGNDEGVWRGYIVPEGYYLCTVTGTSTSEFRVKDTAGNTFKTISAGTFNQTFYFKKATSGNLSMNLATPGTVTNYTLDLRQVGWSGLTDLYNGLIAQGQTAAQAQLAASAWCHHSNDLALGSVYGKIYNGYAKDLLVADLAASNFGYHVATEAEWNAILATGVAGLKAMGTAYWTSANGTNVSGLTLLGGGIRATNGSFATAKSYVGYWVSESNKLVHIYDNNSNGTDIRDKSYGAYILLIKNY